MLKDFKDFIAKGNVIDLAVAVIIAGAFGTIVASLTDEVIMPVVGALFGGGGLGAAMPGLGGPGGMPGMGGAKGPGVDPSTLPPDLQDLLKKK